MSGMANEIAARMEADGLDPSGAAEPGTGGPAQPQPAPPAEALTTDTQTDGTEPGPVPYSRFKEVNDEAAALRGYATLRDYGYDPDSLTRLANFEANYVQDPGATIMALVDNLDLPDESKTSIRSALEAEAEETPAGGGTPSTSEPGSNEPPEWFKPYAERVAREDQAQLDAREMQQREAALNEVISHWDAMDVAAQLAPNQRSREGVKLALIASHAASGQYADTESLAKAARAEWIAERESAVGQHYVPPGSGIGPRSVPSSTATPSAPMDFGGDIKKASAAAAAAMERGELPRLIPGG